MDKIKRKVVRESSFFLYLFSPSSLVLCIDFSCFSFLLSYCLSEEAGATSSRMSRPSPLNGSFVKFGLARFFFSLSLFHLFVSTIPPQMSDPSYFLFPVHVTLFLPTVLPFTVSNMSIRSAIQRHRQT